LLMENWYIGELSPLELYDFGGGRHQCRVSQ